MKKKGSPMNLQGVSLAAILRRATEAVAEASAKCLTRFALTVAGAARFLSSPEMTAPFIAAIVFLIRDSQASIRNAPFTKGRVFCGSFCGSQSNHNAFSSTSIRTSNFCSLRQQTAVHDVKIDAVRLREYNQPNLIQLCLRVGYTRFRLNIQCEN